MENGETSNAKMAAEIFPIDVRMVKISTRLDYSLD
jgi:hypothetical protein